MKYSAAEFAVKEAEALGEDKEEEEKKNPVLSVSDVKLLRMASSQLALTAIKENEAGRLDGVALQLCKKSIDAIQKEKPSGGLPPKLGAEMNAQLQPFMGCHLLKERSVEEYAGSEDARTR